MSYRAEVITRAVRGYDSKLYAKMDDDKVIRIYRKCKEFRQEWLSEGVPFLNVVRNDHLVMSLTDTWGRNGKSVEWGVLPIMARLEAMDLWKNENFATEFFKNEEADEKRRERKMKNSTEDFLYEFRDAFKNATNDINTSSLSKRAHGQEYRR